MKALIVVDYQVDFVNGALGFEGAELLEPIILRKIQETRDAGGKIIFTLDTHSADYLDTAEGKKLPIPHCIEGTDGHKLYGKVAESVDDRLDLVIKKHAFGSMELAVLLKKFAFDEVELCGLVTDICVVSNAIIAKAALHEAKIIVDGSACSSADKLAHERALDVMRGVQIDVI